MNLIEYLTSPQTITSLGIALAGIWAGYKVLEKRVEQNENDIKDIKKGVKDLKEDTSTAIEDIKTKIASIDVSIKELSINVAWIIDLFKKEK